VPWPASKKTTKQLINQIFAASKNREFHQAYQANVSQFRFESVPRRTTFITPPPRSSMRPRQLRRGLRATNHPGEMTSYDCPCRVALPFVFEEGSNDG
jgi:hypothetical protein